MQTTEKMKIQTIYNNKKKKTNTLARYSATTKLPYSKRNQKFREKKNATQRERERTAMTSKTRDDSLQFKTPIFYFLFFVCRND